GSAQFSTVSADLDAAKTPDVTMPKYAINGNIQASGSFSFRNLAPSMLDGRFSSITLDVSVSTSGTPLVFVPQNITLMQTPPFQMSFTGTWNYGADAIPITASSTGSTGLLGGVVDSANGRIIVQWDNHFQVRLDDVFTLGAFTYTAWV